MRIYHDEDAELDFIRDKKIAVIGYGNQGRSQALNLRDSRLQVLIGNRQDDYADLAIQDDFMTLPIREAVSMADVIMFLVPDEIMPALFDESIAPELREGHCLVFASGFNITYGFIHPPDICDVVLVAPRMIGAGVRDLYLSGDGFPSFVGVEQDVSGDALSLALALAKGIGSTRAGVVEVTFSQETELDLFTEQCFGPAFGQVLVNAVELLIEQGYPPEAVLLELYMSGEFAYTLGKIAELGTIEQARLHSLTSQYGSLSRGIRFMNPDLRNKMLDGLNEIRDGTFAKEWEAEHAAGYPNLEHLRALAKQMPLYQWERNLRSSMGSAGVYRPGKKASTTNEHTTEIDQTSKPSAPGVLDNLITRLRGSRLSSVQLEPLELEKIPLVLDAFLASLSSDEPLKVFAKDRQLVVAYYLSDLDISFYMQFDGGQVAAGMGASPIGPQVQLETQSDILDGMFSGRLNPLRTAMSGRLRFSGDTAQALTIQRIQDDLCRLYQKARREVKS